MNPLAAVDTDVILSGRSDWIGPDLAETLSHHPLASIETEFPHHVRSMESPERNERPRERHPVFYGCYDWHSAVHSHWALVRQLRLFDEHPRESEIVGSFDSRFTEENVEREVERFAETESFEKPYGWAWLLHLASELSLWDDRRADGWGELLEPLEETIVDLVESSFLTGERPFRVGTHGNTAFALHCVLDYARTTSNDSLESAASATARKFYADDRDYPVAYEPLGWDFLSPALTEADLMRRVYDRDEFVTWLDGFLPELSASPHESILDPVRVDAAPDEGVALHLVGLNVSRAWCLAGLADALDGHRYGDPFERSARRHAERGLEGAFTDDYAGSHWLSSFVLYLLTRTEGGIAPE
ncbi:DUF2891 domain-containing protein [Halorarum halobium]|uniref:DUF2891 domain-containing protein n=1 Tax=Halorarum halobium TaxID=3075121 RepID=UPI0028B0E14D|nr:DUF2891 domain-containing protein [Halobaculum sp. XH14]